MNYIIFDLEWNQGSEENSDDSLENSDIPFEIIEIGAIKLNQRKVMVDEFSRLVKPQVYHQMHYMTKKLIHIQMEELDQGSPFVDIMKDFKEWCGKDYIYCTWGPLDLIELQRNMRHYDMPPLAEGPLKFLDIQKLFSIAFEDKKLRRTLEYAVDFLGIQKDIPFHRAFSDAYYTGKIFSCIQDENVEKNYSFDVFVPPKSKKEEVKVVFDEYAKYISREFEDKQSALSDREVISTKCYYCNKNLKKKIRWFSTNGKHYLSVSCCDNHGDMKSKIRLKKSEDNRVYVVKTSKFITPLEVEEIRDKKNKARDLKKHKS